MRLEKRWGGSEKCTKNKIHGEDSIFPKMKQMSGITEIEINQYTEVMDTLKREEFIGVNLYKDK